jgi:hypothetical protein
VPSYSDNVVNIKNTIGIEVFEALNLVTSINIIFLKYTYLMVAFENRFLISKVGRGFVSVRKPDGGYFTVIADQRT